MKSPLPSRIVFLGLAALSQTALAGAESELPDHRPMELPAFEVTAPTFTSPLFEFYEKMDHLFDGPWVDAQGGALIQAIIWKHGYLSVHPTEDAVILIQQRSNGRVTDATTVYTNGGKLFANSYALGERVRLHGLSAADIHDVAKIEKAFGGIRDAYTLDASMATASLRGGGWVVAGSAFNPVMGDFTAGRGFGRSLEDTGAVVPPGLNIFYPDSMVVPPGGISQQFRGANTAFFNSAYWGDRFHEAPKEMLDTVYRALHDPAQSGIVPVGVGQVDIQMRTPKGLVTRPSQAVVFDWEGVHYVYRPYGGTVGRPIPINLVTGLPFLCVRDSGLIESIYFSATYLRSHPSEKAVVVPSDNPSAAYTVNGKLCVFSPSLNRFAVLKSANPDAINSENALKSSIDRVRSAVASLPAPAVGPGRGHLKQVPRELPGDTADLQMRRIFVAFESVGIPVHLKSGDTSSLTFTWQGVDYTYGSDQQLRKVSNG